MALDLTLLNVFEAAASAGSMTRAANALSISQPAVSKNIRALEQSLKVRLFDRGHTRLTLTRAGEVLLDYSHRIAALADDAERAMADLTALRHGQLSIAVTPTIGTYVLPDVLVHMRRRFPGIRVHVEIGSVQAAGERLRSGAADFALLDAVPDADGLESKVFAHESLVVIGPARHPLFRKRRPVDAETLDTLPFILRESGSSTRSFAELTMSNRGFRLRPALTLASTEAIKRAVAGGLGFAILPDFAVRTEVASRSLAVLRVQGPPLRRPLYVTRSSGRLDERPAVAFLCLLKHGLRGSLPKLAPGAGIAG